MKNLITGSILSGLLLAATGLSAQTTPTPEVKKETAPTRVDRSSSGAITMEEYETLLAQYQKANPGKTFQDMKKEEFETYLTTELLKLRKTRAEEAAKKAAEQKTAEPK